MSPDDIRLEGLTNQEKRSVLYKEEADQHMLAAQGYEHEGDQTKADACWAVYDAKKTEIRNAYPDE